MEKDLGRLRRGVDAAVDRVGLQIAARLQQLEKLADAPGGQIAHEPVGRQILQPSSRTRAARLPRSTWPRSAVPTQ